MISYLKFHEHFFVPNVRFCILGIHGYHEMTAEVPANPVPMKMHMPPAMKMGDDYEKAPHHAVVTRDSGCHELDDDIEESFACANIYLKNRFR